MRKVLLVGAFFLLFVSLGALDVTADSAPDQPPCSYVDYGDEGRNPGHPATCGLVTKIFSFNLSSISNDFVFLRRGPYSSYSEKPEGALVVVNGEVDYATTSPDEIQTYAKQQYDYFIIRKNYFEQSKGIPGLFKRNDAEGNSVYEYVGKTSELYQLYVSTGDPNGLVSDVNTVKGYVPINFSEYSIASYGSTSHLECNSDIRCEEKIVYVPEKIDGTKILMRPETYIPNPQYLKGSVDNRSYDQQTQMKSVEKLQPEAYPAAVNTPPSLLKSDESAVPVIPFWLRVWNFFASLFQ